jgi:hypothetical protein
MQTDKSSQEKRSDLKTQPCPTDAASSLSSSSRAPVDVKPVQSAAENGLNTDSLEKVNCEPLVSLSNGNAPTPSSNVVKTENSVDSKGKINMNYVQCSLCTLLLLLCKHLLYLSR